MSREHVIVALLALLWASAVLMGLHRHGLFHLTWPDQLLRRLAPGERLPWGHGVAWYDPASWYVYTALWPLHWVLGTSRAFLWWCRRPLQFGYTHRLEQELVGARASSLRNHADAEAWRAFKAEGLRLYPDIFREVQ